ncbi:extensin-like domain-containing protein [Novosphingobium clariflavum]|uniref:Extensin family protein n=1 Tax=Novosphingobium clariflavum TaxID=2029884 RepID=A0ABV6S3H3_9SPHN|nr:extensin family protein [Novosphingobium clariflavum]
MMSLFDRAALTGLLLGCLALAVLNWLHGHPGSDPWAPLVLDEKPGWATGRKLAELRADVRTCRAFLQRSGIANSLLPAAGAGACRREDRRMLLLAQVRLSPRRAEATCAVEAGLAWWLRHGIQPQAQAVYGSPVVMLEHLGTVNCRRIGNGGTGNWSEHATGNGIDIAAFVLANGHRIEVRRDWKAGGRDAAFLHAVRDHACRAFSTVLSPDYNAAHADHLHLDQMRRPASWSVCR